MEIIVDSREPKYIKDGIKTYFKEKVNEPFHVRVEEMEVGDIKCDNILIERKEINDFYSSIIDQRYRSQKVKLAKQVGEGVHTYVLIHGHMEDLYNQGMSPRMYAGAVASLTERGINTIHVPSKDIEYVYEMVYAIIRKYDPNKVLQEPFIKPKVDNYFQKCLMCIEGIGEETAKNIVNKYGYSMESLFHRDPYKLKDDLMRIEGIGWRTSEKIINTIYGRKVL